MSDIVDYYSKYYSNGGMYQFKDYKGASRHLMISKWLESKVKSGGKVVDIGCGDGLLSKSLPEYQWTGLDLNSEMADSYKGTHIVHNFENTRSTGIQGDSLRAIHLHTLCL